MNAEREAVPSSEAGGAGTLSGFLLLIDNYDSFTFNLAQYLGELGADVRVVRNDKITVEEVIAARPDRVVLSPGPCTPNEAGICLALLAAWPSQMPSTPLLGVCLGHQAIGQAFGGRVIRAPKVMHGKTSPIVHGGRGIFANLPSPFEATRYHSLVVELASLPAMLEVTATVGDEIMGLQHRELPIYGVQFHPESILTVEGKRLLGNFLRGA